MWWSFRTRPAERLGPSARGRAAEVLRALTVALVAVTLLAACGIGVQDEPVPVAAPTASARRAGPSQAGVPLTVQVYLVQREKLARVTRTVPPGAGLEPSFVGLAAPITRGQADAGYRSALPITSTPLQGQVVDGVARIDLPPGFERISVREQSLAMAQLVFTVTANSLATSVQLVQGNRPLPVPAPGGQLLTRPVTRVDYAAYDPSS